MAMEKKTFKAELLSSDDKALTLEHFISTETEDSGRDIMLADGMEKRGNVVVLFQHGLDPKFGNEPIAKVLDIRVGYNLKNSKGLIAKTQYFNGAGLTPPDNTGERLYLKAKTGVMPNWSIGFESLVESPTAGGGRIVKKWLLHEYSQVAIGMNSEATCELGKESPEVKFGVIFKREDEVQPESVKAAGKCSDKIAHKAMHILHKAMIEDMKSAASEEGFSDVSAEKCAKACLSEYSESVGGHVASYIKAMVETNSVPVPAEPDADDKSLADVGHKIAHKALKMAHKALVDEIQGCKGAKDMVADTKAEELIKSHEAAALPHATAFIKAWSAKCSKTVLPMEHKSIAEKTGRSICYQALRTIYEGMTWELSERSWNEKDTPSAVICGEICQEVIALFMPYLVWLADDVKGIKAEQSETATVEEKETALKNLKSDLSKYLETKNSEVVPATFRVSTSENKDNKQPPAQVFKIVTPQQQFVKVIARVEPEPLKINVAAVEPELNKNSSLKMTAADVDKIASMVMKNLKGVFEEELNRQKGKVD